MSNTKQHKTEELASVIQLLADTWPIDRDNVALAGAKFESIMDSFDKGSDHLRQLLNLSWEGIKYLYDKDEYFITVKASTMQAINLLREYVLLEGDVNDEDIIKACDKIKSSITGDSESADSVITNDELLELEEIKKKKVFSAWDKENYLKDIIQLLESITKDDRNNVAKAGAEFEEIFDTLVKNSNQIRKLANLTWEGLKYLYEQDKFFSQVKLAVINTVHIFKEYITENNDVKVEDFEKSYSDLEHALNGDGIHDVEELISHDEEQIPKHDIVEHDSTTIVGQHILPKNNTLDDLASYMMMLDEDIITRDQIERLAAFLLNSIDNENASIISFLKEAYEITKNALNNNAVKEGWLSIVSVKIEAATIQKEKDEWESSIDESDTLCSEANNENPSEENNISESFYLSEETDLSLISEFVTECNELIEAAEGALLDLEDHPDDEELVNTVFRAYHTIKGTSAFMGLEPITEFTHFVETLLSMVRDGDLSFDRACADINFEAIDIIKKLLSSVEQLNVGDLLPLPDTYKSLLCVLKEISDNSINPSDALSKREQTKESIEEINFDLDDERGLNDIETKRDRDKVDVPTNTNIQDAVKSNPTNSTEQAKNTTVQPIKNETESSVRVSVNRLDKLIDMVGELVIAHSVVAQDEQIPNDSELQKKVTHATKILRELQDTSLTLRMVPLKATFHKMNRLVRDLSRKAGKPVKFSTEGEDTEIDRNMVDIINEPLVHMLRNSLDHGIETPEERVKTTKSQVANITLRAFQEGGKVVIKIQDDGRGINKDVILKKAIEKGLIEPDKKMSDSEIYGLIFLPGFSSAEKVTDLSGRGVGMDVVRRSIDQLQGKVDVESELGVGTTITIELPFTLAITDGMLIRVGMQKFIIPTINIDMTFRANPDDLFTILGESEQVSFRRKSVPVIRLHSLFEIDDAEEDILRGTMLIIKNNTDRYALLVDEVIGQQQLVGKSINMINTTKHISGGAILGDGRVGLILDTAALST